MYDIYPVRHTLNPQSGLGLEAKDTSTEDLYGRSCKRCIGVCSCLHHDANIAVWRAFP